MKVVVCGAGAIGAASALFLARRGADVTVIERHEVGGAASGKSGGFLALDWCDGSALGPLARRSFALHAELAAESGLEWGYRRLDTHAIAVTARRTAGDRSRDLPAWIAPEARHLQQLGTTETTAQVTPEPFTRGLIALAIDHGATLRIAQVEQLAKSRDGSRVTGVIADGATIDADAVLLAMGPWSVLAARWLPMPAVYGLKGHSVVLRAGADITPHAFFVDHEDEDGALHQPEVFPRPDGTVYVCGLPDRGALPVDPAAVQSDDASTARLMAMIRRFAPALGKAEILRTAACHRPVTEDGLPLMGGIPGLAGAYVATGHSVWGMLNAPASGEAMAELILDGAARQVDLEPFDPARLPPLDPAALGR